MRLGLFGKLPAKRDFVATGLPHDLIGLWEKWMEGGLSTSRLRLGAGWQEVFLKAPLWRFWLGADLCGATVAGVFMPSVDGIGRYFPLSVFAVAEAGEAFPPPELDPQDGWFAGAEELLLSALAEGATYEGLLAALATLRPPVAHLALPPPERMMRLADGSVAIRAPLAALPETLAALRVEDYARAYAAASMWWTAGGPGFPPLLLVARRMPDPHLFAGMLTGAFDRAIA